MEELVEVCVRCEFVDIGYSRIEQEVELLLEHIV